MIFNLSDHPSIANKYIADLRNVLVQGDSLRFRTNLERIGELLAYEISKTFEYKDCEVETPLGIAKARIPDEKLVLGAVLRAGLPMHSGMLRIFDSASNAFLSAYRRHHKDGTFEINLDFVTCPNLDGSTLILCDAMLATGASLDLAIKTLLQYGTPSKIHVVTAVAASGGLNHLRRIFPDASFWLGALDEELTAKSYIVPGLGDAGDLSFGEKMQD